MEKHDTGVLGAASDALRILRRSAWDYVKLGAGASGIIVGSEFLFSRVLVKDGKPLIPVRWGPLAMSALGVLGGEYVRRKVDSDIGTGMIAGGVGVGVSALVKLALSPMTRANTGAQQAAEDAGAGAQGMEGFGFGRAFAGGGFGRPQLAGQSLYGVGSHVGAAGVFNGSTVAIEEGGAVSGANVRFEEDTSFAAILN